MYVDNKQEGKKVLHVSYIMPYILQIWKCFILCSKMYIYIYIYLSNVYVKYHCILLYNVFLGQNKLQSAQDFVVSQIFGLQDQAAYRNMRYDITQLSKFIS